MSGASLMVVCLKNIETSILLVTERKNDEREGVSDSSKDTDAQGSKD